LIAPFFLPSSNSSKLRKTVRDRG